MIVRLQLSFDWLVLSLPLSLSLSFPVSPSGFSLVGKGLLVVILRVGSDPLLSCGPKAVVHYFVI